MKRKLSVLFVVLLVALLTTVPAYASRGHGALGTIYVRNQGRYYDTFVTNDPLPMQGAFQQLYPDQSTDFGPGDPGYMGGRWWEDLNNNGIIDPEDHYFHCPLLGPGRTTP